MHYSPQRNTALRIKRERSTGWFRKRSHYLQKQNKIIILLLEDESVEFVAHKWQMLPETFERLSVRNEDTKNHLEKNWILCVNVSFAALFCKGEIMRTVHASSESALHIRLRSPKFKRSWAIVWNPRVLNEITIRNMPWKCAAHYLKFHPSRSQGIFPWPNCISCLPFMSLFSKCLSVVIGFAENCYASEQRCGVGYVSFRFFSSIDAAWFN